MIDVRHLVGTTSRTAWPTSPEITVEMIKKHDGVQGVLKAGEIVIFHSGHMDRHFQLVPAGSSCLIEPLNGQSEGWPTPRPDVIVYLAQQVIKCVATDGPILDGVDPQNVLMTYWALGSQGMVGVDFLIAVGKLPERVYFLFAPVKIRGVTADRPERLRCIDITITPHL